MSQQLDSLVVNTTGLVETEERWTNSIDTEIKIVFNNITDSIFTYWDGDMVSSGVIDTLRYFPRWDMWTVWTTDSRPDWIDESREMKHVWLLKDEKVQVKLNVGNGAEYQAHRIYFNPTYVTYPSEE